MRSRFTTRPFRLRWAFTAGLVSTIALATFSMPSHATEEPEYEVVRELEMTAPVTRTAAPGGFMVQFVLPAGVTAANAPEPLDARIGLRDVPPSRVAVIRYSGFWSESNDDEHLARLRTTLRDAGLAWTGEPVISRYDPPFKPWFMRRNEIWLHLATGG